MKQSRKAWKLVGYALAIMVTGILAYIYLINNILTIDNSSNTARLEFPEYPPGMINQEISMTDFAGSEACASCHREIYDKWEKSTHGNAGDDIENAEVIGKFDGVPRKFKDATVTPYKEGDKLFFKLETEMLPDQVYEVSAVVGGGHMAGGGTQTYFTDFPDGTIRFLPFDYHKTSDQWFGETSGEGGWLPISEERSIDKILEVFPTRALGFYLNQRNCQECHGSQIHVEYEKELKKYKTQYTSLTINCESCHGPGKAHISKVSKPGWETSADIGMTPLETLNKDESLNICFRCHALKDPLIPGYLPGNDLEAHYGLKYPIHSGTPYLNDGRVKDFGYQQNHLASDCYINGSMTCVNCHDPHSQSYRDINYRELADRYDDAQCTSCHVSKSIAPTSHTFHAEDSEGSKCVSCHMPYLQHKATGSTLRFARSDHTIPIPRPAYDQSIGIENACFSCHQDKTIDWLQKKTEEWYGIIKPHNKLVANLGQVHDNMDRTEAGDLLLDGSTGHVIAQMASISQFTNRFLTSDIKDLEPSVIEQLKAFTNSLDIDVKSLALASLHLANDNNLETHNFLVEQLNAMDEELQRKIRDRWAHAMPYYATKFEQQGDLATAIKTNLKAIEIDPENVPLLLNMARLYEAVGNSREAISFYTQALQIDPDNALGWLNLGNTMLNQGDRSKALAFYKKTLEIDPWNYYAYFNLGKFYYNSGDNDASIEHYKKAIEIYPSLSYVYIHLAVTYIRTKEYDKALTMAKTGVWLDPNDPQGQEIVKRMEQLIIDN